MTKAIKCIVQHQSADWHSEASKLASIYHNAQLTLAFGDEKQEKCTQSASHRAREPQNVQRQCASEHESASERAQARVRGFDYGCARERACERTRNLEPEPEHSPEPALGLERLYGFLLNHKHAYQLDSAYNRQLRHVHERERARWLDHGEHPNSSTIRSTWLEVHKEVWSNCTLQTAAEAAAAATYAPLLHGGTMTEFDRRTPESKYRWLESNNNFPTRPSNQIDTRIWTFQERLFSRCILTITSEGVFWDCCFKSASDRRPLGLRGDFSPGFRDSVEKNVKRLLFYPNQGSVSSPFDLYFLWRKILQDYSQRQWTYASDRVIALQGLADQIGAVLQDECNLGVWKRDALRSLLWFNDRRYYAPEDDSYQLDVPSWCWASVGWPIDCRLMHPLERMVEHTSEVVTPLADVIDVGMSRPRVVDIPGCHGAITLEGSLAWVSVSELDKERCRVMLDARPDRAFPCSYPTQKSKTRDSRLPEWEYLLGAGEPGAGVFLMPLFAGGYSKVLQSQYCLILVAASGSRDDEGSLKVFNRIGLFVMDNAWKPLCVEDRATCTADECMVEKHGFRFRRCLGKRRRILLV